METVDGIWDAELGFEQRVDLLAVAQIRFATYDVLCALGRLGLDNVAEDQADIGSFRVFEELAGELWRQRSDSKASNEKLTIPPSQPPAPVMSTVLVC